MQLLVNLYKGGELPKLILGDKGSLQTSDGLPKGKYATILDGPWMYPQFSTSYPKFVLHTAPVPAGPGGSISVVGGEDIVMTNVTPNKAAAEQFIDYMLSPATQLAMAKVGQMSVRTDLVEPDARDPSVLQGLHEPAEDRAPAHPDAAVPEDRIDHLDRTCRRRSRASRPSSRR